MPGLILGALGLAIILFVVSDVLRTTLLLEGGGPLTTRLSNSLWGIALRVHGHRRHSRASHRRLSAVGVAILLTTVSVWIALIWAGWTMVFSISPEAVVETSTGRPADLVARLYFTGYTLITLGMGDFRPGPGVWQIATALAAANGFFLITLAIAFVLPLISAVVQKRQTAAYIASLGSTPNEILLNAWDGESFGRLADHLTNLALPLTLLGQNHLAYPVLHCFHSATRETALAPGVAALDEALILLQHAVDPAHRPGPAALRPLQEAIRTVLKTLESGYLRPDLETPPLPALAPLRAAGVRTTDPVAFRAAVDALGPRRRLLLGLVRRAGWSWDDVVNAPSPQEELPLHGSPPPPPTAGVGPRPVPGAGGSPTRPAASPESRGRRSCVRNGTQRYQKV